MNVKQLWKILIKNNEFRDIIKQSCNIDYKISDKNTKKIVKMIKKILEK